MMSNPAKKPKSTTKSGSTSNNKPVSTKSPASKKTKTSQTTSETDKKRRASVELEPKGLMKKNRGEEPIQQPEMAVEEVIAESMIRYNLKC